MKLRIEPVVQAGIPLNVPRLRISKAHIALNAVAAELMNVKVGENIWVGEDEENPGDWYIFRHDKGRTLRHATRGELFFCCVPLYKSLSQKMGFTGSYSFQIGTEPTHYNGTKLFPIITAPLVQQLREQENRLQLELANQRTAQRLTA